MTSTTTTASAAANDGPEPATGHVIDGPAGPIAYATHIGLRRRGNHDRVAVHVGPEFTALAIADGVGSDPEAGTAAEIAAEVAAVTGAFTGSALLACDTAQTAVQGHYVDAPAYVRRAGTSTLVVAILRNQVDQWEGRAEGVDVAWLGDSSAWLLDAERAFERITAPHNPDDDPHFLLRHVAKTDTAADAVHLDLFVQPGKRLLLCSDGLDGYVERDVIREILAGAGSAEQARDALIAAALGVGGRDNVTVVVADLDGAGRGRGAVAECPTCGQADPPVTTLGDAEGTVETDCCRAHVTSGPEQ